MKHLGLNWSRLTREPLELAFARVWDRYNTRPNRDGRQALDYLLAEDPNEPRDEATDRDRQVAATVIQWLGSAVGQGFLIEVQEEVLGITDEGEAKDG